MTEKGLRKATWKEEKWRTILSPSRRPLFIVTGALGSCCNTFSLPTIHTNIQWDMQGSKWSVSTGVDSDDIFTCIEGTARRHTVGIGSCGGWEGGSLIPLWDVIRQMHTIGRMVVIYTTPGIVGYLLLWKYSCFTSGTENNSNLSYKQRKKMTRSTIFKHFNNNNNNNNNNKANIYTG